MPTKQLPPEQLDEIIADIGQYRAMLLDEAISKYDQVQIEKGKSAKYLKSMTTSAGETLYLAHKGRRKAGLTGSYEPTVDALSNALALRQVADELRRQGYVTDVISRRFAIKAMRGGETVVAVARRTGYDRATVRRLFALFVASGDAAKLQVYVPADDIEALSASIWYKHEDTADINEQNLKILPVPG
jgi:hypothetical protein